MLRERETRVARKKKTSGRKAVSEEQKKQPAYYYDGKRRQVKLAVSDSLHAKLGATSQASGLIQQDQIDVILRSYLKFYEKQPDSAFVASTHESAGYHTYWIDQDLYDSLKRIADQRKVSMARVFHTGLSRHFEDSR